MIHHLARAGLLACTLGTLIQAAPERPKPPNILWLIAEDMGPALGCYGAREVHTPILDRLAAEGMRFNRFYTVAPVCSPSRSAFNTGMYQTTIGAHNHRSHRKDGYHLPEGVRLLSDRLRDLGYFTANVVQFPEGVGLRGAGKTDWNFQIDKPAFDSAAWADLKDHQPFYAQVNFSETHRAFSAPPHADGPKVAIPPYYPDHPTTRADMAAYLDEATELDRKIGRVLAQLETEGLADSTLVVFFGDNGEAHVRGKQFCYEEGLHVPLIVRWPEGYPAPQGYKAGTVDDRLLMSIDLAPTALEVAGGAIPEGMQGRPILGEHMGPPRTLTFGARDRCDETVMRIRTVSDGRYRYIRNFTPGTPLLAPNAYKERSYPVWNLLKRLNAEGRLTPEQAVLCAPTLPEEELYDLESDPHEVRNLAGSSEHRAALERLRGELERWIVETNDQGREFESSAVLDREVPPPRDPAAPKTKAQRARRAARPD